MIFTTKGNSAEDLIQSRGLQSSDMIKSILNRLKSQGIDAICAGGAIRDNILKQYIKDIDIYMVNTNQALLYIHSIGCDKLTSTNSDTYKEMSSDIVDVYQTHKLGICVQFILVNTDNLVEFVEKTFDSDICKCWQDSAGVNYSEDFKLALETNTINLSTNLDEKNLQYSLKKHFPKLIFKFKEFNFNLDIDLSELPKDNILFDYFKAIPRSSIYERLYAPKIKGNNFYLIPINNKPRDF